MYIQTNNEMQMLTGLTLPAFKATSSDYELDIPSYEHFEVANNLYAQGIFKEELIL